MQPLHLNLRTFRNIWENSNSLNTFHSGVRDTHTFMPTFAYRCTSILVLAIPCQQLPPANANSRLESGMPEVAQNLKSQTWLSSLVFIAEVANKSNLGQECPWKTKTFTVGNLGQKWPRPSECFTIGILGQKWPRKNKNFHHWYPWPKKLKNKRLSP